MKRFVILLSLLIGFTINNNANGQLNISGGIGVSLIGLGDPSGPMESSYWSVGSTSYNLPPTTTYTSPAFNFSADYLISNGHSLGIAACYQYLYNLPNIRFDSSQQTETISRFNIAIRYLYFLNWEGANKNIQLYLGCRVGLSYWNDILPKGMKAEYAYFVSPSQSKSYLNINSLSNQYWLLPSAQVLFNIRLYPFDSENIKSVILNNIGLNFELGIGTPYFAECGLTFNLLLHHQLTATQ